VHNEFLRHDTSGRIRVSAFAAALVVAASLPLVSAPAAADLPEILVSRQLAQQASLRQGDIVTFAVDAAGSGATRVRVVGIYEPTPNPMRFTSKRIEARMHLPDLQALKANPAEPGSAESIGALNIRLVDPKNVDAFVTVVSERAPGISAGPTARVPGGVDPFAVLERFHFAVAVVTVLGSTAFLLALMVMRAEERRETIGIIRLIGVSQRSILLGVLVEGLLIATAGALFGVLVAVATERGVNRFFQWRYDTTLVFVRVTASIALKSIALSVPLGVAAGLAGSWTLLRRDVVALIRR
jgi:ABC-type lipoprotein release transport system permease subunit